MTNPSQIPFQRNAVQPVECIKGGWNLIKNQYWLIFVMCLVSGMISSAVPIILTAPMMCGLFLTFFKMRRGEPIEFGTLFKGFDHFAQSVIASFLHAIPILVIVVPAYVLFYAFFFLAMIAQGGNEPSAPAMFGVMAMLTLFWLVVLALIMIVSIGFMFAYPLIVDRGLSGVDAVKLSFKAAMANFWRLLGLVILSFCLNLGGLLLCFVGVYLMFPIIYSALAIAYEQVFGLNTSGNAGPDVPPPPPVFT